MPFAARRSRVASAKRRLASLPCTHGAHLNIALSIKRSLECGTAMPRRCARNFPQSRRAWDSLMWIGLNISGATIMQMRPRLRNLSDFWPPLPPESLANHDRATAPLAFARRCHATSCVGAVVYLGASIHGAFDVDASSRLDRCEFFAAPRHAENAGLGRG